MKGAREYHDAIHREVVRYKKLWIEAGEHARGVTLKIWIVDSEDADIKNIHGYKNAVLVYGIINGNPGWTEEYGWIHDGPWKKDFADFIAERREAKRIKEEAFTKAKADELARVTEHEKSILAAY